MYLTVAGHIAERMSREATSQLLFGDSKKNQGNKCGLRNAGVTENSVPRHMDCEVQSQKIESRGL